MKTNSYSQRGEDIWILKNIFNLPQKGIFVDAGASHPIINSNTKLFEELGWTGICIDGNPINKNLFQQERNCKFVEAVLSDKEKYVSFHDSELNEISSISDEGRIVKTQTLDSILEKENIHSIDLLSLDVEGHEYEVLLGLSLNKYRPSIVVVEFSTLGKQDFRAVEYLVRKDYYIQYLTEFNFILKSL